MTIFSLELDLKTFVQAFGFRQSSVTEEPPQNMIGGLEAKPHVFPWYFLLLLILIRFVTIPH